MIVILAFFGGLRHCEIMELVIEKFSFTQEGVYISHQRSKQRSDKKDSKFLVPRAGETNFAMVIEKYLSAIREDLDKIVGKVLWTGKLDRFVDIPIGKNMVAKVISMLLTV